MHKIGKMGKSAIALFLAGIMAFAPAGESLAAGENINPDNGMYTIMEEGGLEVDLETGEGIESEIEESDSDTESEIEEGNGSDTEGGTGEGNGSDTEGGNGSDTEEGTGEGSGSDIETGTEEGNEPDSGAETEDGSELDTEAGAEEGTESDAEDEVEEEPDEDAEIDEEAESDTDEEKVEAELPGLENYTLTSEQLKDKKDLVAHLEDINQGVEGKDYVSGEIVFLADTEEEAQTVAEAYGGTLKSFDTGVGVVTLPENVSVSRALTLAATSKDIVLPPAWPNHIYYLSSEDIDSEDTDFEDTANEDSISEESIIDEVYTDASTYTAAVQAYNDPFLKPTHANYQYQHTMVGSVYAWNAGHTGEGVTIAILDSGVNAHPDLNVIGNANHVTTESDATDGHGHGTHVAGLAAAKTNTIGGAGIAPGASIYNIKVANSAGAIEAAWAMAGINDAISKGVDIINMSLGGHWYNGDYAKVVKKAYEAGIAVFVSAGNDGSKVKCYPACYPGAYSIGAVQQNKTRSYFSNYGSWVKFSAPGTDLYSTSKTGEYVKMSGTSQAAPVASGTAAVILSEGSGIPTARNKSRVDALIKKMNKGKISGNGGAAGIVSLPKALGIAVSTAAPNAPVFKTKTQTVKNTTLSVSLEPAYPTDIIYYSIDGKNPTYKNGILSANAQLYTGAFNVGGKTKVTVKAIAVNACGKVSKVATANYTFKPLVSGITITGQAVLIQGKTAALKATVAPDYAASKAVTWTIAPEGKGVTVDKTGKVKASKTAEAGTYTIRAESKDEAKKLSDPFTITVTASAKVKAVEFKDSTGKAKKSDTVTIGAANVAYDELITLLKVTNMNDEAGTIADVDFSSNNTKVATVDNNTTRGRVTLVGVGKAVITATANDGSGKKATFTLTVKKTITSVVVSGYSKLAVGKSIKMTATVNSDATQKKVNWSITPADQGVTVSSNGTIKASNAAIAGKYTVVAQAQDGDVRGSKEIEVSDNAITKIQLNSTKGKIFRTAGYYGANTSMQITATVTAQTASKDSASSTAVEFTSNNPGIAKVSQNGLTATITAGGSATGTAKITCKALDGSGKSAVCTVTVANPASKLTITPPASNDGYVAKGKKIKLAAAFEEEFGAVSSKAVKWESGNPNIATVDSKGNVKGKAGGVVEIRARTDDGSGLAATYEVMVTKAIKKLALDGFYDSNYIITAFNKNYAYPVDVLYNGSFWEDNYYDYYMGEDDLFCPDVSIEVGNPDIISAGWTSTPGEIRVYAKKAGRTTITVKAMDGSNVKKTYKVAVR